MKSLSWGWSTSRISSTGTRSSNELLWLNVKIGHPGSNPCYGQQGDTPYTVLSIIMGRHILCHRPAIGLKNLHIIGRQCGAIFSKQRANNAEMPLIEFHQYSASFCRTVFWGLEWSKHSLAWIIDYFRYILWDVITNPCPRDSVSRMSSYETLINLEALLGVLSVGWFLPWNNKFAIK